MINSLAANIIRWRWLIIVATLLIVAFIGRGATNIGFSSDYRIYFSEDNEQLIAFETLQNTYSKSDNILFVLEPHSGEVFTPRTLAAVKLLTEQMWQLPYSTRVDSVTNYQHTEAEEDDLLVYDLVEFPEETDYDKVKHIALNEPLLLNRLVSPKAHVTAVNATIQVPQRSENELPEVVSHARKMIQEFQANHPDFNVYLTGTVMLSNQFAESARKDVASLIPIMLLVIIVTLWLLLRSVTGTFATVVVIVLSVMSAMGIFGWLKWTLTGPSSVAPVIITTMAVADCVHILVTFLYNMRNGMNKSDAMQESIRINFQPVFITSVTTALGLLSMNFSEVPPLRDLGNTVAMGVTAAFFFSVFFLPAAMMVLPVRPKSKTKRTHQNIDRLAEFVIKRHKPVLALSALTSLMLFAAIPLNVINDEFVKNFKESVQFRSDTDFIADNLTGAYNLQYSLVAGESNGVSDPEFLKQVEAFTYWLKQKDEIFHVESITEIFKRLNKNMHGDNPDYFKLPESKDLAAQYLLLYEMSLPYGLDLNNQLNIDKSSVRIAITLKNISSMRTLELEQEIANWLRENTTITEFYGASTTLMFSHIGKRNAVSMVEGIGYVLMIICVIMIVVLRSWKLGVLSIIPNLVPIGAAFGIWGIVSGNVGMSIGTGAGMVLGVVIDDTVHFLSKYRRARKEKGYNAEQAVRYAFTTVGTALWVTTFVLVAGFSVLGLSEYNINADMGIFTATTILLALIFDFLALPALLLWLDSAKNSQHAKESRLLADQNGVITITQQHSDNDEAPKKISI